MQAGADLLDRRLAAWAFPQPLRYRTTAITRRWCSSSSAGRSSFMKVLATATPRPDLTGRGRRRLHTGVSSEPQQRIASVRARP